MEPIYQSATQRRELRGKIRRILGPSSHVAPTPSMALRAAHQMDALVTLATGSRYRLRLERRDGVIVGFNEAVAEAEGRPR